MGIFDALNTSVGGLQAQSFALQNISGNIANAQTTGFKGINTSFVDLVPEATNPDRQVAGGVTAYARQTVSTQGTVSASSVGTFMAINGDGFFSVQKSSGTVDNAPAISGGAVTAYDASGTPVNLQLRWAKTDSAALGGAHVDNWNLFYQKDPTATGAAVAWVNAGTDFKFGTNGKLTSPTTPSITLTGVADCGQNLR